MSTRAHSTFMRRALRIAERGRGSTAPNPPVGAVLVRAGRVVAEGWHRGAGEPHAEIEALSAAGDAARGATMYVTLEPCTHQGRTPPCVPAVLAAGVERVVIATADPNPRERGAGIRALAEAGVDVIEGVLTEEARTLIGGFATWITAGRPQVTLKLAATLDGKVAAPDGSSRWITGPAARRDVHRMRGWTGAVIVGVGTVIADDPALTCRLRGFAGAQPLRVVLDSSGRTPVDAAILDDAAPTLVATTTKAPESFLEAVRSRGGEAMLFPARDGRVDVEAVLAELGRREVLDVLAEGGPTLAADLIDRGFADRYVFYLAPKILGGMGMSAVAGLVVPTLADAPELTITGVRRVGADVRVEARPRR